MPSLSVFADEAGQQDMSEGYYLLTLVLHDQDDPLDPYASDYVSRITQNGLPDVAFHMKDLLHGHGDYEGMEQSARKKLLIHFNIFMQKAPVKYKTFAYDAYDTSARVLSAKMRRDIINFVFDNLDWFQSFDHVPIYYDHGQPSVTAALHEAFDYLLGHGVADYRLIGYRDRRLLTISAPSNWLPASTSAERNRVPITSSSASGATSSALPQAGSPQAGLGDLVS